MISSVELPLTSSEVANGRLSACTIAAAESLARATVLATTFHRWHPNSSFTILVLGGFELDRSPNVWSLNDLGISLDDAHRLPKMYGSTELGLALKPLLLQRLLAKDAGCAVYLDAQIEVLASLDPLVDLVREQEVVLASRCSPAAEYECVPNVAERFRHEPGFVAVGGRSDAFLHWWSARVREDVDAERSLDRTLLDRIPPQLQAHTLSDVGWNLGYWSLPAHQLTAIGDHYEVDGEPLRFFNFSGYELDKPHLLSKHQGHAPRALLSESPALEKLCREYRDRVLSAAADEVQRNPSGFGVLPSGLKVDRYMHQLYHDARERFEAKGGPQPPDASSPQGAAAFLKWLNQRMMDGKPKVTRYMLAIYAARPDLQAAFPEPLGEHAAQFHNWFLTCGRTEENVPPELTSGDALPPVVADTRPHPGETKPAVNVIGYFRAELGIAEAARLLVTALDAAQIPFATTVCDATANRQNHAFARRERSDRAADIDIVCINADQLPAVAARRGSPVDRSRYTIGVWFWEVDEFPELYEPAFDLVDEVWVASAFVQRAISNVSPKPVCKFHLPIVTPEIDGSVTRAALQLPERFCFLFSFDFLSVLERKNPLGLIDAFRRAFRPGEGPVLVLKTINGQHRVRETERLKYAIENNPDITLLDGYRSPVEKNTLTALCDCYISLHRSEGFGLTMAEAMALGKPAIATGYSGNLEFMTAENSYLCRYAESTVGPECEPYPSTAHWAEPDLDHAALLMREVYLNQPEAQNRGRRAAEELQRLHSPSLAGETIAQRLDLIRRRRSQAALRSADLREFTQKSGGADAHKAPVANASA